MTIVKENNLTSDSNNKSDAIIRVKDWLEIDVKSKSGWTGAFIIIFIICIVAILRYSNNPESSKIELSPTFIYISVSSLLLFIIVCLYKFFKIPIDISSNESLKVIAWPGYSSKYLKGWKAKRWEVLEYVRGIDKIALLKHEGNFFNVLISDAEFLERHNINQELTDLNIPDYKNLFFEDILKPLKDEITAMQEYFGVPIRFGFNDLIIRTNILQQIDKNITIEQITKCQINLSYSDFNLDKLIGISKENKNDGFIGLWNWSVTTIPILLLIEGCSFKELNTFYECESYQDNNILFIDEDIELINVILNQIADDKISIGMIIDDLNKKWGNDSKINRAMLHVLIQELKEVEKGKKTINDIINNLNESVTIKVVLQKLESIVDKVNKNSEFFKLFNEPPEISDNIQNKVFTVLGSGSWAIRYNQFEENVVAAIIPKEGVQLWCECASIIQKRNTDLKLSESYIKFLLDPKTQEDLSNGGANIKMENVNATDKDDNRNYRAFPATNEAFTRFRENDNHVTYYNLHKVFNSDFKKFKNGCVHLRKLPKKYYILEEYWQRISRKIKKI